MLFLLPAVSAMAQKSSGPEAELAFRAVVDANELHRKTDTPELLEGLIGEAEPGSDTARSLIYRLAAVYYRQLKFAQAEALIAPLGSTETGGSTSVYKPVSVREGMMRKVQRGDLTGALALGESALPRYTGELSTATMAEEIIESAYADTAAGSPERTSIENRRGAISARALKAHLELARLHGAIGEVHHALKQYPEAEKQYRAALALFGKRKDVDAVALTQSQMGLALLLRAQGDAPAALPLQRAALVEMKKIYPANHPDRLESEKEIAQLQAMLRKASANSRTAAPRGTGKSVKLGQATK